MSHVLGAAFVLGASLVCKKVDADFERDSVQSNMVLTASGLLNGETVSKETRKHNPGSTSISFALFSVVDAALFSAMQNADGDARSGQDGARRLPRCAQSPGGDLRRAPGA